MIDDMRQHDGHDGRMTMKERHSNDMLFVCHDYLRHALFINVDTPAGHFSLFYR